jgi:hypothetical protein
VLISHILALATRLRAGGRPRAVMTTPTAIWYFNMRAPTARIVLAGAQIENPMPPSPHLLLWDVGTASHRQCK